MTDTSLIPDSLRLVDIDYLVELTSLSKPTLRRMNSNSDQAMPRGIRIGRRSIRWRLRTGNPATGILDWIEAGCDLAATEPSNQSDSGRADEEEAHGC